VSEPSTSGSAFEPDYCPTCGAFGVAPCEDDEGRFIGPDHVGRPATVEGLTWPDQEGLA
jgi:hypothetical protein